jgi:hypothetical protein
VSGRLKRSDRKKNKTGSFQNQGGIQQKSGTQQRKAQAAYQRRVIALCLNADQNHSREHSQAQQNKDWSGPAKKGKGTDAEYREETKISSKTYRTFWEQNQSNRWKNSSGIFKEILHACINSEIS